MEKRLPEICTIQYGYPFDSAQFSDSQGIPLIRIRDVVRGYSETYTTEACSDEYLVRKGDLLIGMDGEFNIAKWGAIPALLNQRVCRLIPGKEIDKGYLFYFMPSALKKIEDKTPFVTVKHLSAKELNKILVPVPPMEEQRRVAEILDCVSNLISKRHQQLAKLDELVKARFVEMFGGYYEKNERPLNAICNFIDYRGKTPEKASYGIPLITAKNVKDNSFSIEPQEFIPADNYDEVMTRGIPKHNDVLFTTEAPLGNVCRIPNIYNKFCVGQRIITMQPNDGILTSEYLEYALLSKKFQDKMWQKSSGSTVKGIRSKLLEWLTIPVPPIELQNVFSSFVSQIDKSKLEIQKSLDQLENLKKSLMQQYFG